MQTKFSKEAQQLEEGKGGAAGKGGTTKTVLLGAGKGGAAAGEEPRGELSSEIMVFATGPKSIVFY